MKTIKFSLSLLVALIYAPATIAATTPVLGSNLAAFSVFAGVGGVTNTPTEYPATAPVRTNLSNWLGTTNTEASGVTGFFGAKQHTGPGIVAGYNFDPGFASGNSAIHQGDALATITHNELIAAQTQLEAMNFTATYGDLSGMTLTPGVYSLTAPAYNLGVGQTLILNGAGFVNPQWVFLGSSSIIMDTNSVVSLVNADAGASVYWDAVSSITINAGASMVGNFLARTSITMLANANITCGRVLDGSQAGGGNVTMSSNLITSSNCGSSGAFSRSGLNGATADQTHGIPEPDSLALVLAGFGMMGVLTRRRKAT